MKLIKLLGIAVLLARSAAQAQDSNIEWMDRQVKKTVAALQVNANELSRNMAEAQAINPSYCGHAISVPDFAAKDFRTGKEIRISSYRGKPIVLNLWFASCPTCRDEAPSFRKLAEENKNITVLSMTNPRHNKSPKNIGQFLDQYNWTFPTLLDEGDVIRNALLNAAYNEYYAYPTTYFFDKRGMLVGRIAGRHIDWEQKEFTRILQKLQDGSLTCYFPAF